jgi:hypothetical protein
MTADRFVAAVGCLRLGLSAIRVSHQRCAQLVLASLGERGRRRVNATGHSGEHAQSIRRLREHSAAAVLQALIVDLDELLAGRRGQAARAGGPWLCMVRWPSGLMAVTVASALRVSCQPQRCTAIR